MRLGKKREPVRQLVASIALYQALATQARVFGHPLDVMIVGEVAKIAKDKPSSGEILANQLKVLFRDGLKSHPDLHSRYVITPTQIVYNDGRYISTIRQGQKPDTILIVWQIYSKKAGRTTLSFSIDDKGEWTLVEAKISDQCTNNPALLAEAGGEVIGYLVIENKLPKDSFAAQAVLAHMQLVTGQKDSAINAGE